MKKAILLASAIASAAALSGCAVAAAPLTGVIYTDMDYPITATATEQGSKTGEASATSILGIIATGNASVAEAAKNGGITKVKTVDVKATSIIGIYAKYTVVVTGE
ncbi:TRL-like family protein [uncultured Fibrobacter sp.]|uniref:TRL-like family protein n=1 Tax=uncultured Fibrobacter sp. TaxID=261512 RepID=UPI002631DF4A|nr:TRL-like family protein [uncultured Fibrobacter sp.]